MEIPANIRTQLQNQLTQWKSNSSLLDWDLTLTENIIERYHPPSRTVTCMLTITYHDLSNYQTMHTSLPYATKKDAERHAVFMSYEQLQKDILTARGYIKTI